MAAQREDSGRFIVRADEKLTAFVELESAISGRERRTQLLRAEEGRCNCGEDQRAANHCEDKCFHSNLQVWNRCEEITAGPRLTTGKAQ